MAGLRKEGRRGGKRRRGGRRRRRREGKSEMEERVGEGWNS